MPSSAAEAAAVAVTRFGLGARPGEIERVSADPRAWLEAQVTPAGAPNPPGRFVASPERMQELLGYRGDAPGARPSRAAPATDSAMTPASAMTQEGAMGDPAAEAALAARRDNRQEMTRDTAREFLARAQMGATTEAGFAERWALFWANVFTASATKFQSAVFMGPYEREAIRPHVFGKFEDLALAAEQHPAMLLYLDQAQSVGPNSQAGQRRNAGLNENLAREILELHTVGADGGYSQADVTEFARALTGWSTPTARDQAPQGQGMARANNAGPRGRARRAAMAGEPGENAFVFRPVVHEPGERTVLGRTYAAGGKDQAEAVLRDLARRPETARRLARKLAVHFTADDPPPALVDRLEAAWTRSGGDLAVVARALIAAPEAWSVQPLKVKTPYEFILSTHRALGSSPARVQPLQQALVAMGQPAFSAPSPEGWPDTAADWAGPDALVKRLDWARAAADLAAPSADPNVVAAGALGARLGERTRQFVARAESRPEALTLFLMSPEFQRR